MTENEELKARLKELEDRLHQSDNFYKRTTLKPDPKIKPAKLKLGLKYKFLIWFAAGLGVFTGISLLVGLETLQLFLLSVMIFFYSLSSLVISLILVVPMLILIYIAWKIYKAFS